MRLRWIAVPAFLVALVVPARAQFDPAFNHLFCYGMHEQPEQPPFVPVVVDIETQLGLEQQVTVMRAAFLCAPAKKTGGGVDPLPPTPVPHFTCYRPKRGDNRNVKVNLTDQFGSGDYTITSRRLLCAPTSKSTTTTSTTSSTTSSTATTSTTSSTTTTTMGCPAIGPDCNSGMPIPRGCPCSVNCSNCAGATCNTVTGFCQ